MDEYLQTRLDKPKDNQYYTLDEETQHDGQASYTPGTSFNSKDKYCKDVDLHEKSF
jgi:rRNA maturation protein Nop10